MHLNSRLIFTKYVLPFLQGSPRVLEIGPDAFPSSYSKVAGQRGQWDTVDIFPRPGLTFVASNENSFPIEDGAYDVVISGQVLEHVRKPWIWMHEVVRVCKPGGLVVTIAPTSWPYHEAPIDCWRVYPAGMQALLDDCGVEVLVNESVCLEEDTSRHFVVPGRSAESQWRKQRLLSQWLNGFGVPRERAFDLVCIARKR
ncbi:hypothetical protein CKO44_02945 [Rubrivivax gelatinosus]|uniref:Methyltransferase type 11 domain-containing protein n=1 Tax=Rubrivivax gelatinosus TaxID=28068 RepID=A0ABS1DW17_RUBGE|nr:methyltransferase domain-containing protein [Rubrivivax gelatinosus]MBK1612422.1 hypothetical protein [Rubrivivax gelatinosus]MBK1713815.1 hypothetical protein [Rubrivivax gelatinosus]MBZ8142838.1 hypothetical protein [Rubrivivax gelatinosus]